VRSRLTPGKVPPVALDTGSVMTICGEDLSGRRNAKPRPCSINAVSVIPRRAASCRARSSKGLLSLTVVLICPSISMVCLYVNHILGAVASVRPAFASGIADIGLTQLGSKLWTSG
jgi:hypothetical protein